jgi:hypothetical protein
VLECVVSRAVLFFKLKLINNLAGRIESCNSQYSGCKESMDKNIRRSKIQVLVDKADEIEFKIGSLTDDINLLLNREVRINI